MQYKNYNSKNRNFGWKQLLTLLVALVLIAIVLYLEFIKHPSTSSGTIPTTKTKSHVISQTKSPNTTQTTTKDTQKGTGSSSTNQSVNLTSPPTGTFVSNHHPSLSGSTKPSAEQSTCNTVPGATCYIKFINGDVVKTLPTRVADEDGTVIWNWDVARAGFTEGSWKIIAVAQSGNKIFSATDNINLDVQL